MRLRARNLPIMWHSLSSTGVPIVNDAEQHRYCTNKFIELANEFKTEKIDINVISGSLMTASAVYATYVASGNKGTDGRWNITRPPSASNSTPQRTTERLPLNG
jgi:hypothetical protein